jgi:phosphoenolpyruvate carboxylase
MPEAIVKSARSRRVETDAPKPSATHQTPAAPVPPPAAMPEDRPLLKAPRARFPVADDVHPRALTEELGETLDRMVAASVTDPFSNPVLDLSLDIAKRLERGEVSLGALEQVVQHLSTEGFVDRAQRLGRWLGEIDPDANAERLRALFRAAAQPEGAAEPIPFAGFQAAVERELFGIVMTAHPTFSLTAELTMLMSCLATGRMEDGVPLDAVRRADVLRRIAELEHRPESEITLAGEHERSLGAIANILAALRQVHALAYEVAAEIYPEHWMELTPRLITVASWVGYDLDGRSDIRWTDTLHKRLKVEKKQLEYYLAETKAIAAAAGGDDELWHTLEQVESRLALAIREVSEELEVFADHDPDSPDAYRQIQKISRRMHEGQPYRLVDAAYLIERLNRAIRLICPTGRCIDDTIKRLCVLRAELASLGLGTAHTHVRLNSTQIHNAIRKAVGLETEPDDPRYRQSYQERITQLLDKVEPVTINFGSLIAERTSAKRLFMIVAQMLKYADATVPVRFLIAESEAAFTLLAALYYAKLFGIADRLDISPLFETERAMEAGSRLIDQLLENPHYRAYVETRGRLCIQTGYSDAGRYLGQTPAAASIERLRSRVAELFRKHGLSGVQLVVFDTHGESIGRGSHPASLTQRLSYIAPPAWLQELADKGVPFKQEISFQGGDGFLPFATRASAFAVVTRILEYMMGPREGGAGDPFYDERDYVKEFFTTVMEFQKGLVQDPKYAALISAFGPGLLFASGSRPVKRQHDGSSDVDQMSVTQIRAIPHNAILQQLGLPANTIGGLGAAIEKDPDRYERLYATSRRFRELMGVVEYGAAITDPDALKGYISMLDPELWLRLAARSGDATRAWEMRTLAKHLEQTPIHGRQMLVFRKLYRDATLLAEGLARTGDGTGALVEERTRRGLRLLHAIRLALIQEAFRLSTHIPDFSSQHQTSRERVITMIVHLDIPPAVALLKRIFPATADEAVEGDFGETATYRSDENQSYGHEHDRIIKPLSGLHDLITRVGGAVIQRIGFFG